jgi:hypothetical protein
MTTRSEKVTKVAKILERKFPNLSALSIIRIAFLISEVFEDNSEIKEK